MIMTMIMIMIVITIMITITVIIIIIVTRMRTQRRKGLRAPLGVVVLGFWAVGVWEVLEFRLYSGKTRLAAGSHDGVIHDLHINITRIAIMINPEIKKSIKAGSFRS